MSSATDSHLRTLRLARGLTQKALADIVGMNISQIQKLESGTIRLENITFKNGLALADALGVDPHEFF